MFTYPYRPLHHYPYPCICVVQGARHRGGIPLKEGVGRSIVVIEEWPRWNWGRWKRRAAGANMTKTKFYSTQIYVCICCAGGQILNLLYLYSRLCLPANVFPRSVSGTKFLQNFNLINLHRWCGDSAKSREARLAGTVTSRIRGAENKQFRRLDFS